MMKNVGKTWEFGKGFRHNTGLEWVGDSEYKLYDGDEAIFVKDVDNEVTFKNIYIKSAPLRALHDYAIDWLNDGEYIGEILDFILSNDWFISGESDSQLVSYFTMAIEALDIDSYVITGDEDSEMADMVAEAIRYYKEKLSFWLVLGDAPLSLENLVQERLGDTAEELTTPESIDVILTAIRDFRES